MSLVKTNRVLFPAFMNEFFKPDWLGGVENVNTDLPAVNIKENEKDFELELAMPGMKKDDFNIEVEDGVLTISSEVNREDETKEENYTRKEFSYSSFRRSFTLPESVNEDNINATYVDGILRLTLPKKEEALPKPKRMIDIA
ncbi:MAG: molecular chaperone Hsp20 [Muricauda sp.]|uniref:Molecular chaperone Hsp20 n=1 Tax=Flagellimonas lutaonensis TaxID=516051 RepID=A0A0D5YQG2_9FLAO|nr:MULTISPECIES: Hsp20/alpha crystallin family protein [Allomuricauda]AKA34118.1 molecular chaperone Hsp20 [Allomuricauda lutaonensis]MAU25939.1 molecular chaperone Hsp20 [Allomuricauda sp.]MBC31267.1 molecular chaperone Hsp20 [Allomuricauda sp.]|tara:strand:+ start:95894 stop:96319 length:426 start_codon:yes stop_codon:yes gene_type:complete